MRMPASMSALIVITGPIASGKSTVADALAARLADDGRSVAVADLDDLVESIRAPLDRFDEMWLTARRVHGHLVAAWMSGGMDVVVAHGPIFTREDEGLLLDGLPGVIPRRVLLRTPFAVAAERVALDPTRVVSKDLTFLRSTYDAFEALISGPSSYDDDFDTSLTPVPQIVERLSATIRG